MKKRLLVLLSIIVLVISITACGGNGELDTGKSENIAENTATEIMVDESTTQEISSEVTYPLTLVDQAGREVVIEKKPESLVSSYYITTSAFIALDLADSVKGIESNPERRAIYKMSAPALLDVTQVGSPKEFDLEVCATINPDLVVLPMRAKDMVEPLEKLGITVMVVNPESQSDIIEMIQLIGQATDKVERAKELSDYILEKTDYIAKKVEGADVPTVYFGGNSSFLSTASKGMYQNDQMTIAGGKNVAGDIDDTYWVESSYEQILEWNPKYIILASDAKYELQDIKSDSGLMNCQAIKDDNVYQIPSDIEAWDSPVPASFLGTAYLASVLHPDLVSNDEYENMVGDFYEKFYGFSWKEN